jgi:hypothetical protein
MYNAHMPTSSGVRMYRQRMEESFKSTALLVVIVVILRLMKNFLDVNSLMFNKY